MPKPCPLSVADVFVDFAQGILYLRGSEIVKERHREESLIELSLEHHISHELKFHPSSFNLVFQ